MRPYLSGIMLIIFLINTAYCRGQPLKKLKITSDYGNRIHPITGKKSFHKGIDFRARYDSVYTIASGQIISSGYDKLLGYFVKINHGKYQSLYGHLHQYYYKKGDYIKQGQVLGLSGNTGRSTAPHLHFSVYENNRVIDPKTILKL